MDLNDQIKTSIVSPPKYLPETDPDTTLCLRPEPSPFHIYHRTGGWTPKACKCEQESKAKFTPPTLNLLAYMNTVDNLPTHSSPYAQAVPTAPYIQKCTSAIHNIVTVQRGNWYKNAESTKYNRADKTSNLTGRSLVLESL